MRAESKEKRLSSIFNINGWNKLSKISKRHKLVVCRVECALTHMLKSDFFTASYVIRFPWCNSRLFSESVLQVLPQSTPQYPPQSWPRVFWHFAPLTKKSEDSGYKIGIRLVPFLPTLYPSELVLVLGTSSNYSKLWCAKGNVTCLNKPFALFCLVCLMRLQARLNFYGGWRRSQCWFSLRLGYY